MTRGIFRIKLGGVRAQEGDANGKPVTYIMKHREKTQSILKDKQGSETSIKSQCRKAKDVLDMYSLLEEESPYGDADGEIKELAEAIDAGEISQTAEHIIDILRPVDTTEKEVQFPRKYEHPDLKLAVEDSFIDNNTEGMITAGKILQQKEERRYEDEVSGARYTILNDPMEPMLLAVAVLRNLGIPAYPAIAQARLGENKEQVQSTIIAIINPESEDPLITFQLLRSHPVAEAIDVISDEAMLGGTYAMKAANEGKKLASEMVRRFRETDQVIPEEEIMERLKVIGELLYECAIRWERSPMISNAISTIGQYVYNAAKNTEGLNAVMAVGDESILEDPHFEMEASNIGLITAEKYTKDIIHYMDLKLAKEMAKEETPADELN